MARARVVFLVNIELHIETQDGQLIHDTIHPHLSTGAILLYIGGSFILLLEAGNVDPWLFPIRNINIFQGGLRTEPDEIAFCPSVVFLSFFFPFPLLLVFFLTFNILSYFLSFLISPSAR